MLQLVIPRTGRAALHIAAGLALLPALLQPAAAIPVRSAAQKPAAPADVCKRLTPRLPGVSLAQCQKLQLQPTGVVSRNGFPLLLKTYPAARNQKEPLRVLLLGGIHGDELTAAAIVFQWMQFMNMGASQAQNFSWRVAPVVNPDGLLAGKPQRVNANGVDLNRNFPTPGWQKDAPAYWTRVTGRDPRRYPGKSPLSEPESRWLNQEIERFRPHVIVSVHAPFGVLDLDGPANPPERFGRLVFNRVGVYPGSLGNYGGANKNVPVITIELPNSLAMPPAEEVRRIWADMLGWMEKNVSTGKPPAAIQRTALR
ncbi:M14 family zinc carboxypeptidase [Noviherbaspirillum galbum]|uniref:M14 family zinc carboxypeptidase n=1 Tax=Noviherbaspirillum galbum TaxID=2709383 RepID=UPI001F4022C4|nr:M14 family zinc carboxypeptidase [Noviherbaspirillum galbum]